MTDIISRPIYGMVVVIIHLESTFVAYLIAISLRIYFHRHFRRFQIIIIENASEYMKNQSNHDIQPWCGVNTFNNLHLANGEFIINHFLNHILIKRASDLAIYPLDLVNVISQKSNLNNMDIPSANHIIRARLSQTPGIAMIYHPILLTNHLRQQIYSFEGVTLLTLAKGHSIHHVAKDISVTYSNDSTVVLNFTDAKLGGSLGGMTSSFMTNSNLSQVQYIETNFKGPRRPPSSLLWLPYVRSRYLGQSQDMKFRVHLLEGYTMVSFKPSSSMGTKTLNNIDLFHGLKSCDGAILIMNELVHRGVVGGYNSKL